MAQAKRKGANQVKPYPDTGGCQAISNPAARRACIQAAKGKKNKIIDTGTPNNPRNPMSRKKNPQY